MRIFQDAIVLVTLAVLWGFICGALPLPTVVTLILAGFGGLLIGLNTSTIADILFRR